MSQPAYEPYDDALDEDLDLDDVTLAEGVVDHSALRAVRTKRADSALPVYGSVDEFVREWLRYVYRRPVGHRLRWAADWWNYDEAVNRLTVMWRSWEALRQDPGVGMSHWYRDHADYHMAILLSPDGPFAGSNGDQHTNNRGDPLPYTAPPDGMFPDERQL
ncbi:DUF4913 domain-containing protein [Cellulomonas endophytica]|uniref:DUF4913 domain-containing protein n=1 Tax=Cellulomonas endophytica TaxID=2494735 RepID=UPI001010C393|nr:DUF4913 domain-containing protein [Cellulomonas endophytica]